MDEKLEMVKELLKKYGQEQLLDRYDVLPTNEKMELLDEILTINFEKIKDLYKLAQSPEKMPDAEISAIPYIDKSKLTAEQLDKYTNIGIEAIKAGKFAVATMAGGQGSRLGHKGPKGTYYMGDEIGKTIFEILTDNFKKAYEKYGVYVNWYIMTSHDNDADTKAFFEKNNYFGYPKEKVTFFIQGEQPILSENGKLMLNKDGKINQAANGHGGLFSILSKTGILHEMKTSGIEWVYVGGVDNIIAELIDPLFIGVCIDEKVRIGGKSVVKAYPEEKVGVFCLKNGKPSVIEYTELPKEEAEARLDDGELKFAESHILCNMFNVDVIEEMYELHLPYHVAHKKISYMDANGNVIEPNEPNAYKFERFIFDAFENVDRMVILRVKREEEFAPVKNSDDVGVDCPSTARKLYIDKYM